MQTTIVWQKCLIIDPETKNCLVMQRSDYKKDPGKRDIVWWSVDLGEDLIFSIKREAKEETWIELLNARPLDIHSRMVSEERFLVFNLRVCDKRSYLHSDIVLSEEHTAYKRVDLKEFLTLNFNDTIEFVKPQIKNYLQWLRI